MKKKKMSTIEMLKNKGVEIPNPESVHIAASVDPERISGKGVVIYAGCKLFGESTLIASGARLGYEGPVTVENCYIGPDVKLNGGFFKEAVFLKGASMGAGAHVREGTILEEKASGAHMVGLKQTILLPFVTLGSLINFCDCLMSGGTGSVNHSEVGSSFIHFNYTPNQDKATASLIGDVPHGVMLNQPPIFLGGQGGIVGPVRLAFGTITAAGSICRKDELKPGHLIVEGNHRSMRIPFKSGGYSGIARVLKNNITYLANLAALKCWYLHVRSQFISDDFPRHLLEGLILTLDKAYAERVKRLKGLCDGVGAAMDKMAAGASDALPVMQQKAFVDNWTRLAAVFDRMWPDSSGQAVDEIRLREDFLNKLSVHMAGGTDRGYLHTIQSMGREAALCGSHWLQTFVDQFVASAYDTIPALRG